MGIGALGQTTATPEQWALTNVKGSSNANLSRANLHRDPKDSTGFNNIRVAPTRMALQEAEVVATEVE